MRSGIVTLVLIATAVAASPARAQRFEPVPLDVVVMQTAVGEDFFSGPLPLTGSFSGLGYSGSLSAVSVDGAIELTVSATLNATSGAAEFELYVVPTLALAVPDAGGAETPVVFDLERIASNPVLTTEALTQLGFLGSPYESSLLGRVSEVPRTYTGPLPIAVVGRFPALDGVLLDSFGWEARLGFDLASPATESFTDVYRIGARALRPVNAPALSSLSWGLPLLAGLLLGLSVKGMRRGARSRA